MSRPAPNRAPTAPLPRLSRPKRSLSTNAATRPPGRRPSFSGALPRAGAGLHNAAGGAKAQRTSKTTQKLVLLPSAPQTKPLLASDDEELQHGYETDRGVRDVKSAGERMSKAERAKAGFARMTAYCVAEGFKMKLLASFLKREHNVQPRVFDEAMYVVRMPVSLVCWCVTLSDWCRHTTTRSFRAMVLVSTFGRLPRRRLRVQRQKSKIP